MLLHLCFICCCWIVDIFFLLVVLNHWENVWFIKIRIKVYKYDLFIFDCFYMVFFTETHVEIRESVRSKDVFIIQTGSTK